MIEDLFFNKALSGYDTFIGILISFLILFFGWISSVKILIRFKIIDNL